MLYTKYYTLASKDVRLVLDCLHDAKLLSEQHDVSVTDALLALNILRGEELKNELASLNQKLEQPMNLQKGKDTHE